MSRLQALLHGLHVKLRWYLLESFVALSLHHATVSDCASNETWSRKVQSRVVAYHSERSTGRQWTVRALLSM